MIGQTISHYKILEKLGEGGMGVVYKAEDTKLKRIVALKFLPSQSSVSPEDKQRLTHEAQAASVLNHPNISHIYEIDEVAGEIFIAMEFIEGQSLRNIIDAGPMKMAEAVDVGLQIAEGLKTAHGHGVVHRDIKPDNIIITKESIAKIADFGVAKKIGQAVETESTVISGTIAYMSPEQLQGQHVSHLTDIWSLGVVLYEMVTGQRPFGGEYEQATMYSIAHEPHRPIIDIRSDVPLALTKIIDRCLEKVPRDRFPDAVTLLDELRLIQHELKNPRTGVAKSIAVLPFTDLSPKRDNEYFSDGLSEEIIANLSKLRLMRVVSRTTLRQYERAKKTAKQVASDLGVQYILEGSVRKHDSDLRITAQLIDAGQDVSLWAETYKGTMEDIFDIQETVAARIVKALKLRLTPGEKKTLKRRSTENTEAYQLYLKGRFFWNKRNKGALETAIRYFEEAIEKDARYALAWAGLADAYNLLSEYGGVTRKETYPKAKAAVEKALKIDGQLAEARTSLASLMMLDEWNWSGAGTEFKRAIDLNANYATAHHWYAEWLLFTGNIEKAIMEITLAANLDPLSPAIVKDKGMTLYYARRFDDAIEEAKKTLELDPGFASAHRLFSLANQGKGTYAEAISHNQRWGEMTGNRTESLIALAQLHAISGKRSDALKIVEDLVQEEPKGGNVLRGIALTYAALGERDLAFTWLEKAYEVRAESLCSLKVDPKVDTLRSDPRFSVLLKKIGLEK